VAKRHASWEELSATTAGCSWRAGQLLGRAETHVNVLQHLMGYLKKELSSEDKQELLALIEEYRQELVPLIVRLPFCSTTAAASGAGVGTPADVPEPYPKELMLRNHV